MKKMKSDHSALWPLSDRPSLSLNSLVDFRPFPLQLLESHELIYLICSAVGTFWAPCGIHRNRIFEFFFEISNFPKLPKICLMFQFFLFFDILLIHYLKDCDFFSYYCCISSPGYSKSIMFIVCYQRFPGICRRIDSHPPLSASLISL